MDKDAHAGPVDLEPNALRATHARAAWLPGQMLLTVVHAGEEDERLSRELFAPPTNGNGENSENTPESTAVLLSIHCDTSCIDTDLEHATEAATALTQQLQSLLQAPVPDSADTSCAITRRTLVAIGSSAPMAVLAALECDIDALILLSPVAAELATRKNDDQPLEGFARCFAEASPLTTLERLKCRVLLAWPAGGSERTLRSAHAWRVALDEAQVRCESVIAAFSGDRLEADVGTLGALRMEIDRFLHEVARNGSKT